MRRWIAIGALALTAAAAGQADKSAQVTGGPAQFFGADAYPPEAQRAGEQGRVVATLTTDAGGRVSACVVAVSSGSAALDTTTCRIAPERMTFTPARDHHGRTIASNYTLPVRWVLPTDGASLVRVEIAGTAPVTSAIEIDLTIGGGGLVERCVVTEAAPVPPVDPCAQYPIGFRMNGGYTRDGVPVRTHLPYKLGKRLTVEP